MPAGAYSTALLPALPLMSPLSTWRLIAPPLAPSTRAAALVSTPCSYTPTTTQAVSMVSGAAVVRLNWRVMDGSCRGARQVEPVRLAVRRPDRR